MILMIDNYDSFTYNLVQYLRMLESDVRVYRNDKLTLDDIASMKPSGIVISPGPGRPESAGLSIPIIKTFSGHIPILGVCLGHQSIVAAFGGDIIHAKKLMHGKTSIITTDKKGIYKGLDSNVQVMRYHSLSASDKTLPDVFDITSYTEDGEVMGVRHKEHLTEGIQFHPESIMTPSGMAMLKNFIEMTKQ